MEVVQGMIPLGGKQEIRKMLVNVTGPFFLGFAFEYLGMGVVLMLGIQYFVQLSHNSVPASASIDRNARLGPILVFLSILFNLIQTVMDMVRGWDMFALNFLDIRAFASPDYMWFASPFLGLFPAMITQAFLLRRITLFLSSLSSLWPALDRPLVKTVFVGLMSAGIIGSFITGSIGSYAIWKSGPLWEMFYSHQDIAYVTDLIWLSTSSAVDLILSIVLSLELWWARRKLAARGGIMAKVTWQLLLITFHGGIAVTALQLTALFLFEYKRAAAFCYLPMLFLSKIYTITLILSLTLPQSHQPGHTPSHVFSLPNLNTNPEVNPISSGNGNGNTNRLDNNRSPYNSALYHRRSQIPVLPPLQLQMDGLSSKDKKDNRKSSKSGLSSIVARSWRLSQDWLSWSLISNEDAAKRDREERGASGAQSKWKTVEDDQLPPPPGFEDAHNRRPSEPNSLAPLLAQAPRSSLSLNSYPTMSTYVYGQPDNSYTLPHHYNPTTPTTATVPWSPALSTPPRSITVSRTHSFSTASTIPRRSSITATPTRHGDGVPQSAPISISTDTGPGPGPGFRFDSTNPFNSAPRQRSVLTPIKGGSEGGDSPDHDHGFGLGTDADRDGRPGTGRLRLMSFEDMLSGPKPGKGPF